MQDGTLIADLIQAGVAAELIQRIVTELCARPSQAPVVLVDEAAERRRAADRERKAAQREIVRRNPQKSAESADKQAVVSPPLPSPSPLSPVPPIPAPTPDPPTPNPGCEGEGFALSAEPKTSTRTNKARGTQAEVVALCAELGLSDDDGEWFFLKAEGCGWKNGGKSIVDWRATVRAWQKAGHFPSQKQAKNLHQRRPRHQAYDPKTATEGKTLDQILNF